MVFFSKLVEGQNVQVQLVESVVLLLNVLAHYELKHGYVTSDCIVIELANWLLVGSCQEHVGFPDILSVILLECLFQRIQNRIIILIQIFVNESLVALSIAS